MVFLRGRVLLGCAAIVLVAMVSGCNFATMFGSKDSGGGASAQVGTTPTDGGGGSGGGGGGGTKPVVIDPSVQMQISGPYYTGSDGAAVPLNGAAIDATTTPGQIKITLDAGTFATVSSLPIGFSQVGYSPGAVISAADLAKVRTGAIMPYTVVVTSPDGTKNQSYSFSLAQQSPVDANISGITATVKHQELVTQIKVLDNASAVAVLKSTFLPITVNDPGTDYMVDMGSKYSVDYVPANPSNSLGDYYVQAVSSFSKNTPLVSFPALATQVSAWDLINNAWKPDATTLAPSGAVYTRTQTIKETSAQSSDPAVLTYLRSGAKYIMSPTYSARLVGDPNIGIGLDYLNAGNAFTATPGASGSLPPISINTDVTVGISATFTNTLTIQGYDNTSSASYITVPSNPGGGAVMGTLLTGEKGSYYISNGLSSKLTAKNSASLSFPVEGQTLYSPQGDYFLFYTITVVKSSSSASFTNIGTSSSLVASTAVNGNTLTLTMLDPGAPGVNQGTGAFSLVPKQAGIVATFTIATAGGSSQSYTLSLK